MSAPSQGSTRGSQVGRNSLLDPVRPALVAGATTGTIGLLSGGAAGILRSTTPLLFSIAAGVQCFSLGASFWYFRGALLQQWSRSPPSPGDKTRCSTVAGTLAGAANGALRSRANIIPGAIVFTSLGLIGQATYNKVEDWRVRTNHEQQDSLLQRISRSKWMPMKPISDEDYIRMLDERSMTIDVEIALINEKIDALKEQRN